MQNNEMSAGTNAEQSITADVTTSSQTIAKPNVVGSGGELKIIALYSGKTKLYHGTTLSNLNSMLKGGELGTLCIGFKGRKKINLPTYATKYLGQAKQYANERSKISKNEKAVVLSFIVDADDWASADCLTVGGAGYSPEKILTDEDGTYVFNMPIELKYITIHCVNDVIGY